jgi:hypothetical protein
MLHHPTHERLAELGLLGAAAAFAELRRSRGRRAGSRRLARPAARPRGNPTDGPASANAARFARLRHPQACPEDIDYRRRAGSIAP